MEQIAPLELDECLRGEHPPHLLDVREVHEHAFAAIPNSRLIPLSQLPERIREIDSWKREAVVVYCHHGIRSQHAIAFLSSVGFERLINLQSGIDGWSIQVDPSLPRY